MPDNILLAGSATNAARLLAEHAELPRVAAVEIVHGPAVDEARVAFQLSASTSELARLVAAADVLGDDASVSLVRRDRPHEFVSVEVHGYTSGTPVTFWTHPGEAELAELWKATGHDPEPNVRANVSLDALRAAAESTSEVPA